NRAQIADLFHEKLGERIPGNDPTKLVALARRKLRESVFSAEMGISGANFLIADSGVIAISTNEGNGRLCTSVPRIHVVVTGIEKVLPRLEDLAVFWPVLATSGTGQAITTYSTLIGGPRQAGEADGPDEFHVVPVDNRRNAVNSRGSKLGERMMFRLWRSTMLHPRIFVFLSSAGRRLLRLLYRMGLAGSIVDPMRAWNRYRSPVPLPAESFRSRWRKGLAG